MASDLPREPPIDSAMPDAPAVGAANGHLEPAVEAAPPVLGIDVGTQKTVVAAYSKDVGKLPVILSNNLANQTTPTIVSFRGKERFIGEDAVGHVVPDAVNTISSLPALLAAPQDEISKLPWKTFRSQAGPSAAVVDVQYTFDGALQNQYSAEDLVAMLLRRFKRYAEKALKRDAADCVLAHPGHWSEAQKAALINAARIAGLNPLQLIPSIVAAAFSYSQLHPVAEADGAKKFLFIDVGHSCISVAIVAVANRKLQVLAEVHDGGVGARHFDLALVSHMRSTFEAKHKLDPLSGSPTAVAKATARLLQAAEKAKHTLSTIPECDIDVPSLANDTDLHIRVSRVQFNEWCKPQFDQIARTIAAALTKAGLTAENIDVVEVIGGGVRVPEVQAVISKALNGKELSKHLDGSSSVATGAALAATLFNPSLLAPPSPVPPPANGAAAPAPAPAPVTPFSLEITPPLGLVQPSLAPDAILRSSQREDRAEAQDLRNDQTSAERNKLESTIYDLRSKLQAQGQIEAAERQQLLSVFSSFEEWLGDTTDDTPLDAYVAKNQSLLAEAKAKSKVFAQYLSEVEEKRKKEQLEALEAEAERSKQPRKSREDRPKSNPERIELAQKAKHQGNICFKELDYLSAAGKYINALQNFDQMWDVSESQQKEVNEVKLSCYLNLAACYLKLQKFERAIENARMALEVDPKSTKALFRRSQAHSTLKNWEAAKKDLVAAQAIDPNSAEVKAELAKVQKQLDAQAEREKKVYAKMFG